MIATAFRLAMREMRGGMRDFPVLLICLALGVAAISGIGSIRAAIQTGLSEEAATLLGGDAQMQFTYRFANDEERAWMQANAVDVSELVDFRSMAVAETGGQPERALTQVKAVDDAYPLYGQVILDPPMPLASALEYRERPGLVAETVLLDRLGLSIGDTVRLGTQEFDVRAVILREPDNTGAGFAFGPRTIVQLNALTESGLLAPGTLFDSSYRLRLREDANLETLAADADARFRETGLRWRDLRNASPGTQRFVERIGAFLVLVGLAGLIVGGIGVAAAVRNYLDGKTATIATLKTLGARGRDVMAIYFIQIGLLAMVGIAVGLLLGCVLPILLGGLLADTLPVPARFGVYFAPLAEAALYGTLTAAIFSLWPISRAMGIRAASLFRDATETSLELPRFHWILTVFLLVALLVGASAFLSETPELSLWVAGGIAAAFLFLILAAIAIHRFARALAGRRMLDGSPLVRLAFRAIGSPGNDAAAVILSMGLGLTVLAAIAQIDANLRNRIQSELPQVAPSFFMVDIQNTQLPEFLAAAQADPDIEKVESAAMLRGIITRINGQPAEEVVGEHWVLRGDRGVTYGDTLPDGAVLTDGTWWEAGYSGPPLVSFAQEEAAEMGIGIGDVLTVNILGRDIDARIHNLRVVDFSTMGINFIMVMNETALSGAPHSHIATVYSDPSADARLVRDLAGAFPNVTAIQVRDAIDRVADVLDALASATRWGAAATLLTGFVVLIGAAAAGEKRRTYEAAVLKTLGAVRARILLSFAIRAGILGMAAGLIAIGAGILAGWAVMTFVMEAEFSPEPVTAIAIVAGGALANLAAGTWFSWRAMQASAAKTLRSAD